MTAKQAVVNAVVILGLFLYSIHAELSEYLPEIRASREGRGAIVLERPDPSLNGKIVSACGQLEVVKPATDPELGVSWPGLLWIRRLPQKAVGKEWKDQPLTSAEVATLPRTIGESQWEGDVTLKGCKLAPEILRQFNRTLCPRMEPPKDWRRSGNNGVFLAGTPADPKAQAYRLVYRVCAAKTVTVVARYQDGVLSPWWPSMPGWTRDRALVAAGIVSPARVVADHSRGYRSLLGPVGGMLLFYFVFVTLALRRSALLGPAQLLVLELCSFLAVAGTILHAWFTAN